MRSSPTTTSSRRSATSPSPTMRPVGYRNLATEELGSVHEGRLELTPRVSGDGADFALERFAGNRRKKTGGFYTPGSLVQCLLDSALDPVLEAAVCGKSGVGAERAICPWAGCTANFAPPRVRSTWRRPTPPQHHPRAEFEFDLPPVGPRRRPRPRRLGRVRQLNEQSGCASSAGACASPSLRRHRSNVLSANPFAAQKFAAGLARPVEPLDQLPPLRGGAPHPTSRTTCQVHDSARLRVVGSGE